jgi:hypothetical protein
MAQFFGDGMQASVIGCVFMRGQYSLKHFRTQGLFLISFHSHPLRVCPPSKMA